MSIDIDDDDTVYDILIEATRKKAIQIDATGIGTVYVKGIEYIYELQYGSLSGWVYRVNGKQASVGCSQYVLKPGDNIEWIYSLELGNDI